MAKEVGLYGKRGLFIWQKRSVYMAQEACLHGKRGRFIWQKRPVYMAKEVGLHGKRGLFALTYLRGSLEPIKTVQGFQ